jgi:hypothetical protein
MNIRYRAFAIVLLAFAASLPIAGAVSPGSVAADFEACNNGAGGATVQSRLSAYSWSYTVVAERYGGADSGTGCWINDNVALTSEGADCSGFVAKAWFLSATYPTSAAFTVWPTQRLFHPMGLSSSYMVGHGANSSWNTVASPTFMDAGAISIPGRGHIALLISASANHISDTVLEESPPSGQQGPKDMSGFTWRQRLGWNP